MGTPEYSTNCKASVYGGGSACSPELPLCFAIVSYYLLWSYQGATAAGAEALHTVAPRSVKKNILRISAKRPDIFYIFREKIISFNAAKSVLLEEFKGNSSIKNIFLGTL